MADSTCKENVFNIRKAEAGDLGQVLEMTKGLYSMGIVPPREVLMEVNQFQRHYEEGAFRCIVVEMNQQMVGYSLFYNVYNTSQGKLLFVEDIFIKEDYRRHGIGREIFRYLSKEALENGCCGIKLEFYAWNTNAIKFYNEMGGCDITIKDELHVAKFEKSCVLKLTNV